MESGLYYDVPGFSDSKISDFSPFFFPASIERASSRGISILKINNNEYFIGNSFVIYFFINTILSFVSIRTEFKS